MIAGIAGSVKIAAEEKRHDHRFHSVSWQVRDRQAGVQDGESDFILAHPEGGMLIIEAKESSTS